MPKKLTNMPKTAWSASWETASWRRTCPCRQPARSWHQSWVFRGTQQGNGRKPARREGRVVESMPEDLAAENARLRRENQKLRDTNELLKAASAFFASEPDPQR
ncbi:hypothetical protein [Corynebacterium diphtheriae]|uniref:hypothetical protein n=1 Tax=Corynebacterium diphtheriae TaxID=1717 RepID=UPI0018C99013|nr:hypothetical protein [Corynebacterium diphtheriae]